MPLECLGIRIKTLGIPINLLLGLPPVDFAQGLQKTFFFILGVLFGQARKKKKQSQTASPRCLFGWPVREIIELNPELKN